MNKLVILGSVVGFYLPIFLMIFWLINRKHKRNADKEIDAKRRETFKVVKKD